MLKKLIICFVIVFSLGLFAYIGFTNPVSANQCTISDPTNISPNEDVTVTVNNSQLPVYYTVSVSPGSYTSSSLGGENIQFKIPGENFSTPNTTYTITVNTSPQTETCLTNSLTVSTSLPGAPPPPPSCTFDMTPKEFYPPGSGASNLTIEISVYDTNSGHTYEADLKGITPAAYEGPQQFSVAESISTPLSQFNVTISSSTGDIKIIIDDLNNGNCSAKIADTISALSLVPVTPGPSPSPSGLPDTNPCGTECLTALGNIPTDAGAFVGKVLTIATGLAGGIAFILMVIGAIRVLTSTGNPQNVNAGRDMIVAALAGLIFIILSVLILKFIGVNIFGGGLNPFS